MKRYPSIEKPWMQFFSEEAQNAELKHETIYQRIWDNNYNYPIHTALNFFGNKISYAQLFQNIDRAAGSLTALGVKAGDTVACFSVTIRRGSGRDGPLLRCQNRTGYRSCL